MLVFAKGRKRHKPHQMATDHLEMCTYLIASRNEISKIADNWLRKHGYTAEALGGYELAMSTLGIVDEGKGFVGLVEKYGDDNNTGERTKRIKKK